MAILHSLAKAAVAAGALSINAHAQTTFGSWTLPDVRALGAAGDVDGDGVTDVFAASAQIVIVMSSATGEVLHSLRPGVLPPPGWQITSAAGGGDIDNDGRGDVLMGLSKDDFLGSDSGTVWAFSGRTGQPRLVLHGLPMQEFGTSLAFVGDADADGHDDFAVGAPGANFGSGQVQLVSGRTGLTLWTRTTPTAARRYGSRLTVVGDLDADGLHELAIHDGAPCCQYFTDVDIISTPANGRLLSLSLRGAALVQDAGDFDSDGTPDLLASIDPDTNAGPMLLWHSGQTGAEIAAGPVAFAGCCRPDLATSGVADLDGDGLAEEFAAPLEFDWQFFSGSVRFFRGAQSIGVVHPLGYGAPSRYLPLVATVPDVNGDGADEFLVATYGGSSPAFVHLQTMVSPPPQTYCSAKINSLGCVPAIQATGVASITTGQNLSLQVDQVINQRFGMFLWGSSPTAMPFLGGTLCVHPPLRRTAPQSSAGSASGVDCSGVLQFDVTAMFLGLNGLALGDELFGQFWYRDPAQADGTASGLSNAARFLVCF